MMTTTTTTTTTTAFILSSPTLSPVTPTPPLFSSTFTPAVSFSPLLLLSPSKHTQCSNTSISQQVFSEPLFRNIFTALRRDDAKRPTDFRTMTTPTPFLPNHRATVVSTRPLTPKGEYVELVIDTVESGVYEGHIAPGQTLRLGRVHEKNPASVVAVISSPPQSGPFLRFLIASGKKSDPCQLASLKPGDTISTGTVFGNGIDYETAPTANGNLFMFIDAPQAYAVVTSLVEWPAFRAMTGTGANRTTRVTVFYSMPKASGIPYANRFSDWCLYAVNIIPIQGSSILEFMSVQSSLSQTFVSAQSDFAIAAVTLDKSYEALFNSLVLLGFRRNSISKFTEEQVANHKNDYHQSTVSVSSSKSTKGDQFNGKKDNYEFLDGMPQATKEEYLRQELERQIWESWVQLREEMRVDFEKKWAAEMKSKQNRNRSEEEKRHAWASWSAKNEAQWTQVKWDDQAWNDYWKAWSNEGTGSAQYREPTDFYNGGGGGQQWNQSSSQEYWDWVGKGAKSSKRSTGRGPKSYQGWYDDQRSNERESWDTQGTNKSSYQRGGYRYEYDEDAAKQSNERNSNQTGSNSRAGGRRWTDWGRWNGQGSSGSSGSRSYSSSSSSYSSSSSGRGASTTVKLDLYGVLGINSGASRAEIKTAYRKKAMEHHPDRNRDNVESATVKMKQVVVAWSVLKDEGSRRKYDLDGDGGL